MKSTWPDLVVLAHESKKVHSIVPYLSKTASLSLIAFTACTAFGATPTVQGQSGYVNMPNASVEADGTFTFGYGYDRPYGSFYATATPLPFLQVTARYVSFAGIAGFSNISSYGRYKDKVVDTKIRLLEETSWLPAVAVGVTDLQGTELFKGRFLVATKTFGALHDVEASVGWGGRRPDGVFAGARWHPSGNPYWSLVAEYDANNYVKDFAASSTYAGSRRKGPVIGAEYHWGWLGAQIARHRDHFSANAFISVPFNEREFYPKFAEPAFFQPTNPPRRVNREQWREDPRYRIELVQELVKQDFRNVRVELDEDTLRVSLTNNRISNLGRAVGRAARTLLAFAPEDTKVLSVTYTEREQAIATFEFLDLVKLSDYFSGLSDRDSFLQSVRVRYANPADRVGEDAESMLVSLRDEGALGMQVGREGDVVQLRSEDREASRLKIAPKMSFFFNDPSGALRYDLSAGAYYDKRLREGLYLNGAFRMKLFENVSGVTQKSNSLLPHVRTDVAEYFRGDRLKLDRLLLNQYLNPAERIYARLSAGFYEEMYRGVGGQVLYLPKDSRWALDLSVDALQQRGFKGWFDRRDYQTVTGLGALHYRLPYDITVTGRVGRFLARDNGVRLEFKRRFASGVELGAWYTKTNGRDITSPGTPENPYNDKGVFLSVPLSIMLPSDSQASAGMVISPWTRDVGQMVTTPTDLYGLFEQPRRDLTSYDGLGNFAERADEQNLPAVQPQVTRMANPWPLFRYRIEQSLSSSPRWPEWGDGAVAGGSAVLAGMLLDKPVDRLVKTHLDSKIARGWGNAAKALPVALTGVAGAAVLFGDARAENTGLISLQSVIGAVVVSTSAKRLVGRARPYEERGACRCTANRSDASFPSNHATVAFAAVTPFAREYDAPWLYGLAAAGSMGRVVTRQHWLSDVVAGGVLGYAIGSWLWNAQREDTNSQFTLAPGRQAINFAWSGTY